MPTDRPNRDALSRALDAYRDALRGFIAGELERAFGEEGAPEAAAAALGERRRAEFEAALREGASLESAIHVEDFPAIVRAHQREAFADTFGAHAGAAERMSLIAAAREAVLNPPADDIDGREATARIQDIATLLGWAGEDGAAGEVRSIAGDVKLFGVFVPVLADVPDDLVVDPVVVERVGQRRARLDEACQAQRDAGPGFPDYLAIRFARDDLPESLVRLACTTPDAVVAAVLLVVDLALHRPADEQPRLRDFRPHRPVERLGRTALDEEVRIREEVEAAPHRYWPSGGEGFTRKFPDTSRGSSVSRCAASTAAERSLFSTSLSRGEHVASNCATSSGGGDSHGMALNSRLLTEPNTVPSASKRWNVSRSDCIA